MREINQNGKIPAATKSQGSRVSAPLMMDVAWGLFRSLLIVDILLFLVALRALISLDQFKNHGFSFHQIVIFLYRSLV